MTDLPDDYDPDEVEPKWRNRWREMDVYRFEGDLEGGTFADTGGTDDDTASQYIIDTPPPYPTGNLHVGNALGWCYIDFAARYHRLAGDDVLFPQGWDCHGLPTEVKVEEKEGIHRTDIPRAEFRQLCIEHTESQIDAMRETMHTLGFSIDWDHEYVTMDPEYWGETQRSFVRMAAKDYVYREEHPVNWCPRCETAIADAEVETEEGVEGTLYYITFPGVGNDDIEIATTRPELLGACVSMAVEPGDERYADRIGDTFEVPLFGQEVELIEDQEVDGDFGTGAVMICTFGDKQDVDWWIEYDLDLRMIFTEDGRLAGDVGEYEGLSIDEAKAEIVDDLEAGGQLNDQEPTEQNVGQCWRCDTPIEILSKEQWFVEVRQDEIIETAQAVEWIPEHMYNRLAEWTEGMEWDWVVSRQREFATPIPAWFCANEDCGHTYLASEDELPVTPTETDPAIDSCPDCGGEEWIGETDVMDTWMDSSITPLMVRGWPDIDEFHPTALRPQGHDIIRTWAFYTLLRVAAIEDERPWDDILINGMVFGDDGHKMSKSRDNFVQPEEVVEEYSADAFRQAIALGGQPGADIQFQWKEVTSATRFQTKLWNITKFAAGHLADDREPIPDPAYRDVDRWILSKCARVAEEVGEDMDDYRFDAALRRLRTFIWHDLADDYLELIKGRLYEGRPGERDAARQALFTTLSASLRMLSPFAPFLAEEAWGALPGTVGSVHGADWPTIDAIAPESMAEHEAVGELIADVAGTVRGWKSDQGMALNADLGRIEVYPDESPDAPVDTYDLSEATNAPVQVLDGEPSVELVPVGVDPDHSVIGPEFRDQAGQVIATLEDMDPETVKRQQRAGEIEVDVNGEVAVIQGDAVEIREEHRAESGEEVVVLEGELSTILVYDSDSPS